MADQTIPDEPAPAESPARADEPAPDAEPAPADEPAPRHPTAHDAVFRKLIGQPANAASVLRSVLPAAVTARLDLARLRPEPSAYLDDQLRSSFSDLLFSVPLLGPGPPQHGYVLLEHQSTVERRMALRLHRYIDRVWDRDERQHPGARQLPPVVPLVLYHGDRPWTGPPRLTGQIALAPGADPLLGCQPQLAFFIDDLSGAEEQQLRSRPLTPAARVTLLLLCIAPRNPDVVAGLQPWMDQLHAIEAASGGLSDLIALFTYTRAVSDTPDDQLRALAATLGPVGQEAYMTTAEMLRAEGEVRGQARLVLRLLNSKFGPLPDDVPATVGAGTASQLETWSERILTASTLDEVFRDPQPSGGTPQPR